MLDNSLSFTYPLCADINLSQFDPAKDQVWELNLKTGEPPAISLQTTYGLSCLGMRLFPSFTVNGITLTDPRTFAQPPRIIDHFSNYARLSCCPFSSIDVELEYWVPSSQVICGRVKLANTSQAPVSLRMEWVANLQPAEKGQKMNGNEMGVNTVLQGNCGDLYPVFFITGGPEISSKAYPALELNITLPGNASRRLSWAIATLDSVEASFTLARHSTALIWDSEITKIEMEEKQKVIEFSSDMKNWSELIHETQIKARQLLVVGSAPEKRVNLVYKRHPDTRLVDAKLRKKNVAYTTEATVYHAWMLSRILLPGNPECFKEILYSYIDKQQPDGTIPLAMSQSGAPSSVMAPPLLAGIVKDVYPFLNDKTWLAQIYPPLLRAYRCWFHNPSDLSTFDLPTWESPIQTGLESSPLYSHWKSSDQGLNLRTIFSPSLAAMLYKEGQALLQLARWLDESSDVEWLQETAKSLQKAVASTYDPKTFTYRYLDYQSSRCDSPEKIHEIKHNGVFNLKRNFKVPRRLLISCSNSQAMVGPVQVNLQGFNQEKAIQETLYANYSFYREGVAKLTSEHLFTKLEQVEISGLKTGGIVSLDLAGTDREDISLLLPLWAGIPSAEQAKDLIENTLLPRYLSSFGLASFAIDKTNPDDNQIIPLWNAFLIEGLLNYGYKEAAAKVTQSFFDAVFAQWQQSGSVNSVLRCSDGKGIGEKDSLAGLPALWSLLRVLGLERITHKDIILNGLNDFFPPITVQYERVTLQLLSNSSIIETLNGSRTEIHDAGTYKIVLP